MRPRVAWFSPVPPVESGISAYTAELVPELLARYDIDVFVDDAVCSPCWLSIDARTGPAAPSASSTLVAANGPGVTADAGPLRNRLGPCLSWDEEGPRAGGQLDAGAARLFSAHDFVHRHLLEAYDLVVYQLGNARHHDYMWPYLLRYPGLVVLHDTVLHHSRARTLLWRGRRDDYRAEFAFAHPRADPAIAEVAIEGFAGSSYYLWPMSRVALASARLAAVHSRSVAHLLQDEVPDVRVDMIPMGVRDPFAGHGPPVQIGLESIGAAPERPGVRNLPRPLFACFGFVTPEKRVLQALRALAWARQTAPGAHLVLVGPLAPHYDVMADVRSLGLQDAVTITGFVPDDALDAWLEAADVCLCLRWPTARETSASWLRCLAAGKPTVMNDLLQVSDVPALDPRSWTVLHGRDDPAAANAPLQPRDAVAVSIDILDEDHSLGLALTRLAQDAGLRGMLGKNARAWWAAHHTLAHMADAYARVMDEAMRRPDPELPPGWPAHLRDDGTRLAKSILDEFGLDGEF